MFESIYNERFIQLHNIKEFLTLNTHKENFLQIVIRLHTTRNVINRRYVKVQYIIANIGGILKFFAIIIAFINDVYGRHKYYEYILTDIRKTKTNPVNTVKYDKINYNSVSILNQVGGSNAMLILQINQ
jgi:hypothetical protein